MLERDNNKYLAKRCKELGFILKKFTSPGRRSVPDWVITSKNRVVFLEMKASGKKPTDAQKRDHQKRLDLGVEVVWTDSFEGIETILQHLILGIPLHQYAY